MPKVHKGKPGCQCQLFICNNGTHAQLLKLPVSLRQRSKSLCESRHAYYKYPALAANHDEMLCMTTLSFPAPCIDSILPETHTRRLNLKAI